LPTKRRIHPKKNLLRRREMNKEQEKMIQQKALYPKDFDKIRLAVASPEEIANWSYGEITKPETINYRTQKPERDGLFDERVFGPVKDWECYCGKYKKVRYKGVICDRCGVEVTRSSVRRERIGHIKLVVPTVHVWYIRGAGGIIPTILNMTISDVESVVYFAAFVVLEVDEKLREAALEQLSREYNEAKKDPRFKENPLALQKLETNYKNSRQELNSLERKKVLSEGEYANISLKYGQIIKAGIGAEAICELLESIDMDREIKELNAKLENQVTASRKKILKRLKLFVDMRDAGIKPEWLVIKNLPVIPPDLRPMVQLDGGRFAASDLNDLYRRVLNRNNRLKKLLGAGAPEVICRNEKRMLQEAVDALLDNNARRGKIAVAGNQRKLRSLSDILRGKQGRFRQNLLGKRVDYSGRSVIVVGPDLALHECGIPKVMALELFRTFVISKLIANGHVYNVKNATKMIESRDPVVWDVLEQITDSHYVMLNRAPTLHRLGIQAFVPKLIEGKAIQIHPLVCQAFNADFDGDQMAVHIPLSKNAISEARDIMLSAKNLLKPASGEPIVSPRFDMILGCYYITRIGQSQEKPKYFSSKNEAIMAWQNGFIKINEGVKIKVTDDIKESDIEVDDKEDYRIITTCVGRILFNNILPDDLRFLNVTIDAKQIKSIVASVFKELGSLETAQVLDKIKKLGFEYATISGMSIGIEDISIPEEKKEIISETRKKVNDIEGLLRRGLITPEEKKVKSIDLWNDARSRIEGKMLDSFGPDNPVYSYVTSGTRGSVAQLIQMAGMKGLVVNPAGEIIEIPIISNYREGLNVFEYFISSHGSRKGRSDTSLRTSDAGYLTRRLVDVSQEMIIKEKNCKTKEGLEISRADCEASGESFAQRLEGRVAVETVKGGKEVIVKIGEEIDKVKAQEIEKSKVEKVKVRSVTFCQSKHGVCQKCYGRDLGTGETVELGVAVGVIAAQAIGEPGTQLTMKTFHLGGVSGEDITSGLPRVEELFESRKPRFEAPISQIKGIVNIKKTREGNEIQIVSDEELLEEINIPKGYELVIKDGDMVKAKKAIAVCKDMKAVRSAISGIAKVSKDKVVVRSKDKISCEYLVNPSLVLLVSSGDKVEKGQILAEGHLNLSSILKLRGKQSVIDYIVRETKAIYSSQGQSIDDKHLEVIIKMMLSKLRVIDEGDSGFVPGEIVDLLEAQEENEGLAKLKSKKPAIVEPIVMGITRVALKTESFLSAASFQETTGVLINAAIRGAKDELRGLKENVIIGKLIPAGTGFKVGKGK
jgi:DNA-directed RNA polymerase subunit beta'